ncbi:MAG TPA: DinB family protein [Chloroflexota bacterium]|nr:DinB family protein [Chloroflexota bacterium]
MSEIDDLISRYAAAPRHLRAAVTTLDAGALNHRETESDWSARQIVHHIADSELVAAVRIRQVLAEREPRFAVFDQDAWAAAFRYADRDETELNRDLDLFTLLRSGTERLLRAAPPERWEAVGYHPERGPMTLRQLVSLFAGHADVHLEQLRRAAGAVRV